MRSFCLAFGLPLLLLACTPVERTYPAGMGGSGGAGSGTVTTTSSGPGGSGGSAPMGSCSMAGKAFTILGDAELDGTPKLDDKLILIPGQENRAMVHVVVNDSGMNRILVRTVVDDTSPLGNVAKYGVIGTPSFRTRGGSAAPAQLSLAGTNGNEVVQLAFAVDPDKGVGVDGALMPLPTPIECLQGGHPGKVAFAQGTNPPQYLVSCIEDSPSTLGHLFAGDGKSMPVELVAKDASTPVMQPELYTYESGTHLVIFGGDKGGTFFSQGTVVDKLFTLEPVKLTSATDTLQGIFAAVPLPADDGVTLITAFFDNAVGKGKFLAGPILAKDYATLAKVPPPGLAPIQDIPKLADVAPIFFPTWDASGIFGGGASSDDASARFYWFTRDGKPLVFGQTIYTSPGATILTANAAPLGNLNTLVVWTEQDDTTNPPKYTVKGQKLICQIKS